MNNLLRKLITPIICFMLLVTEVNASPIASTMPYIPRADPTIPLLMNLNNQDKSEQEEDVDGMVWRMPDGNEGNSTSMMPLHTKTFYSDEWRLVDVEGKQHIMLCNYRYVKYGNKTKCRAKDKDSISSLKDSKELPLQEALSQIQGNEVILSLVSTRGLKLYVEYQITDKPIEKDWAFLAGLESDNYSFGDYLKAFGIFSMLFSPLLAWYLWDVVSTYLYNKRLAKRSRVRQREAQELQELERPTEQREADYRDRIQDHLDIVNNQSWSKLFEERAQSIAEEVSAKVSTKNEDKDTVSGERPDHNIKKPGARKVFL